MVVPAALAALPVAAAPLGTATPTAAGPVVVVGARRCVSCDAALREGARFCNACGATQPAPAPERRTFCDMCGRPLDPGTKFCMSCGEPVVRRSEGAL
jgi:predicted nucleic acid-binding Zn ribbon protein